MDIINQQISKKHYTFFSYNSLERWSSYWYQLKEILSLDPKSVLELGLGDSVVANYIKSNTNINYKSIDIAKDLHPDIIGDVRSMPLADNSFDIVCAFEVLEHIPFEDFNVALGELKRVASKYILISLPHWGRHFSLKLFLPKLKYIKWYYKFDKKPIEHKFNGQHYWEIGKKGYPLVRIKSCIERSGLVLIKDYISLESPYHHFFVIKVDK